MKQKFIVIAILLLLVQVDSFAQKEPKTSLAISLGLVIGSGVLIETIFNYPGIGSLTFAAINSKDYFVINGAVFIMVSAAVTALLIVDLIYPLIDPRIRYQK